MKFFMMCIMLLVNTGCSGVGYDLAMNTAAGAFGNMLDRRMEDTLGNDAGLSDEKLDGKITKKLGRGEVMIKLKGSQAAAPASGSATNLGNATMVRVYNSHATTAYLVTVTTADEAAVIGTFTLAAGAVEYVDKNNTDEIFAANAAVLLTSVIVVG